ncbi:MAG: GNAT family N-acetyltransferase [Candidatus Helarchaeota archaeon]
MIEVRRFKKTDIEAAKRLMVQLCELTNTEFNEERWLWSIKMRLYDALKKNGMFVAMENDNLIGLLMADITIEPTGASNGYIKSVIIDERARGKGVGQKLLKEAIDYLTTMDVDTILVNVRGETERARKLYEKMGFKELYRVLQYTVSKSKAGDLTLPSDYV